jgi:hypothetical protein
MLAGPALHGALNREWRTGVRGGFLLGCVFIAGVRMLFHIIDLCAAAIMKGFHP